MYNTPVAVASMVDYSKWDNLDSGSDSDSSTSNVINRSKTLGKQAAANPAAPNQKRREDEKDAAGRKSDDRSAGRVLEQVEIVRCVPFCSVCVHVCVCVRPLVLQAAQLREKGGDRVRLQHTCFG